MYRAMIVDDEHFIREGIKNCIRWEAYGITEVATATGGQDAIAQAKLFKPHLVLCDIMMDDMNGFDVMKHLIEMDPSCKVIFLTGHDDFKFAQRAVRLGAFDYLLKISNAEEIVEVVKKALEAIEEEAKKQASYAKLKKESETYSPLIRNRMMNRFVRGEAIAEHEERQVYENMQNMLEISYFMIAAIRTNLLRNPLYKDRRNSMTEQIQTLVSSWCEDKFGEHGMMFQNVAGDFIVISAFPDAEDREILEDMFVQSCNAFKKEMVEALNMGITVGISNSHKAYMNIQSGYNEAIEALDYYSLKHKNCVCFREVEAYSKINPELAIADEKAVMAAFKSYEILPMTKKLKKIFHQFEEADIVERRTVIDFSLVLYGMLRKLIHELKVDVSDLFQEQSFYNQVLQINEYEEVKKCVVDLFMNASQIVSQEHVHGVTDNVQFACEYIESHFDEDITLEKIAGMIHLSPSHFSNIFSKETGMSFLQYLTGCRIEKAKIMLMDKNYKAYEVGESVGYPNPHYFSRIFKKHTGIPPTQYRDKMLKTGTMKKSGK